MAGGTRKPNGKLMVVSDESTQKAKAKQSHMVNINFCWLSSRRIKRLGPPLRVCSEEGVDCEPLLGEEMKSSH